jgi:hypothetical protein
MATNLIRAYALGGRGLKVPIKGPTDRTPVTISVVAKALVMGLGR